MNDCGLEACTGMGAGADCEKPHVLKIVGLCKINATKQSQRDSR